MFNIQKATEEQKQVLLTKNKNILVSAAAGSGKTTVMIEKIVRTMLETRTPIENFLVLTFTKASAADMKNKLASRLAGEPMDNFVLSAIDAVGVADIATIHSFCSRILKSYFYEIGLDPTFSVIEEIEQNKLKNRALDKLFLEEADKGNYEFFELADIFSNKRKDDKLREQILKLYDFSKSKYGYDEWFKKCVEDVYDTNLDNNKSAKIIKNYAKNIVNLYKNEISELKRQLKDSHGDENEIKKLIEYLDTIDTNIMQIRFDLEFDKFLTSVIEFGGFGRIPSKIESIPELKIKCASLKEELSERISTIKQALTAPTNKAFDYIKSALLSTKNRVVALNGLMKKFDEFYSEQKKELGVLDFNDLEMNTIKVLESNAALENIKKQYKYIFVDEYQDINSVQETIISKIAGEDNRFMVGDVKQSIYGFRLCDPDIFLEKYSACKNDEKSVSIDLNRNFRSHNDILEFVNMVFDETMTKTFGGVDYKNDARFVTKESDKKESRPHVSFVFANSSSIETKNEDKICNLSVYSVKNHVNIENIDNKKAHIEGLLIAEKINELLDKQIKIEDKETRKLRNIGYEDIVLLVQSRNEYLNDLLDVLDTAGIPISSDITSDVFDDSEVLALKNMLLVISNSYNDKPLFSLMKSNLFCFSPDELAEIRLKTNVYYFYEAVEQFDDENSVLQSKIIAFKEKIALYKKFAGFLMVKDLCLKIISDFNIREYMLASKNASERFSKLNKFLSSLPDTSLEEFLISSDLNNIESQIVPAGKSVRVMTIHKSKGLEFPVVFLIGTGENFNKKSIRGDVQISKSLGACMKYFDDEHRYKTFNMPRVAAAILENKRFYEEEQRLLYVGLTRAINYLFVTGSAPLDKLKEKFDETPVNFMEWFAPIVLSGGNEHVSVEIYDAAEIGKFNKQKEANDIKIGRFDAKLLQNLQKNLSFVYPFEKQTITPQKTSVTKIVDSTSLMRGDFEGQKSGNVSSSDRGTLYHKLFENLTLRESNEQEICLVIEKMKNEKIISDADAQNIIVEKVVLCLNNPEFSSLVNSAKEIYKEMEFYMLDGDGQKSDRVEIQGVIDLLLDFGDGLCVVDYKTGHLDEKTAKSKYSLQLSEYKKAAEKIKEKPVKEMFVFAIDEGKLFRI